MRQAFDEYGRIILAAFIAMCCLITVGFAVSYFKGDTLNVIKESTKNGVTTGGKKNGNRDYASRGGDRDDEKEVTTAQRALPYLELTVNKKFDYDQTVSIYPFIKRCGATFGKYKSTASNPTPFLSDLHYAKIMYDTGKRVTDTDSAGNKIYTTDSAGNRIEKKVAVVKEAVDAKGNSITALVKNDDNGVTLNEDGTIKKHTGTTVAVIRIYDEDGVEITNNTAGLDLKNKKGTKSKFFEATDADMKHFRFLPVSRDTERMNKYNKDRKSKGEDDITVTRSYSTRITVKLTCNDHSVQKTTRIVVD